MASNLKGFTVRPKPKVLAAVERKMAAQRIKYYSDATNMALDEWSRDYQEGGTHDGPQSRTGDQQS